MKDVQATGEAFIPQKVHPALKNMKFLNFYYFGGSFFALLDPDPADHMRIQIHKHDLLCVHDGVMGDST